MVDWERVVREDGPAAWRTACRLLGNRQDAQFTVQQAQISGAPISESDPSRADWHYAGKGVRLGDASKPLFWYKPQDSSSCRVIYADLHVTESAQTDIPKDAGAESQPATP